MLIPSPIFYFSYLAIKRSLVICQYIVVLALCLSPRANSQTPQSFTTVTKPEDAGFSSERLKRLDRVIEAHIDNKWIPGAVVLLIKDGKIAYFKPYGYSNVEKKTLLKKDDIFRIASQTKAITSLAVMMLFEEGKFLLDDPISMYIPEFKEPKILRSFNSKDSTYTTEPAIREITIRQLLTHTSGIDYASIGGNELKSVYAKAKVPSGIGTTQTSLGEMMKILGRLPIKHQPGEAFTYGLNTDVLGYLVEVVSGMSLNDFFLKKIFEPLGMKDTYFYLPKEKQERLVTLYENSSKGIVKVSHSIFDNADPLYPNSNGKYYSGGAGLSSTIEDYAKFLQLFLNGGEFNGNRLLSKKTVDLMLMNQVGESINPKFGLGFEVQTKENDSQSILTLGSFMWGGAFSTTYFGDPEEKVVGLLYTQMYMNYYWNIGEKFKVLSYQALID